MKKYYYTQKLLLLTLATVFFVISFNAAAHTGTNPGNVTSVLIAEASKSKKEVRDTLKPVIETEAESFDHQLRLTVSLGGSAYLGDIVQNSPILKQTSGAISFGASYDIFKQFKARLNLSYLGAKGDDRLNKRIDYQQRNLNFKSSIWEAALLGQYDFFNSQDHIIVPYMFFGPGIYHFNPTTTDRNGNKVNLHDVGTEGQFLGNPDYDNRKYKLTQLNLQLGGGVRYEVNNNFSLGLELSFRKLFTDYLDDISGPSYPAPSEFTDAGQTDALQLSYRGDELGFEYEQFKGRPRGNPDKKDIYYSLQVGATFLIKSKVKFVPAPVILPKVAAVPKVVDTDKDGIIDSKDECPAVAGVATLNGCPDTDKDGIADKNDKCPNEAGLSKYNGCPIPDTDKDGINDEADKCPNQAGTLKHNGCPIPDTDMDGIYDDEDKCPLIYGLQGNGGCPALQQSNFNYRNVQFATGSAVLTAAAKTELNKLVTILNEHPEYKVAISGYTDNTGKVAANLILSQKRADAAKAYLVSKGINTDRLTSSGFGIDNPVADNATAEGRTLNRRLEFTIGE